MSTTSDLLWRTRRYLNDHWVLKWFVVPVVFMAAVLFGLGLFVTDATPAETIRLTGLFAGFSFAVVAVGLLVDRGVRRLTGGSLLDSDGRRG